MKYRLLSTISERVEGIGNSKPGAFYIPGMSGLDRLLKHGRWPEIAAIALLLGSVVVYVETDLFTAQEGVAFGTLFLALITALTVYNTQKQTEYMRKEVEFMRRPRLSIHHEKAEDVDGPGGVGSIVFENTGQVPEEATLRISLAPVPETDSDDPILDDNIPYEELPDEIKVYRGAGDWRRTTEFLEPGQKRKYDASMFSHELTARDSDYEVKDFHWLRVDGELSSNLSEDETMPLQRLFLYSIDDSHTILTPYSFTEARNRE